MFEDIKPTGAPPATALLRVEGVDVPVKVKTTTKGEDFTIDLTSHDELFDFERYFVKDDVFALAEAAGEVYEPAIPLLKFPFFVGQPTGTWTGTLSSERSPHPAHATITIDKGDLQFQGATVETVHVNVLIFLDQPSDQSSARRTLEFWFAPNKGLLKREFNGSSIREPTPD